MKKNLNINPIKLLIIYIWILVGIGLLVALFSTKVNAQQPIMKYMPMFAGSIVKGGLDATLEGSHFWPSKTAKLFGTTQERFDPAFTWPRKYKNGDPAQGEAFFLSTTLFVSLTDPYHRLRTANNFVGLYLPVLYPVKQTKWDKYLIIPAIQFVGQSIGFTIVEHTIKNQRP